MPRMPKLPEQGPGTKLVLKGLELAFPDIAENNKQRSNEDRHASDADDGKLREKSRAGFSRHLNPGSQEKHSQSRHSHQASVYSKSRGPSKHSQSGHIPSVSADRRASVDPRASRNSRVSDHSTPSSPKPPKHQGQAGDERQSGHNRG